MNNGFFNGKTFTILALLGGGWWLLSRNTQANYGYLPEGSANHDCGCGG